MRTGDKRRHAGTLVLWFVVACKGAGAIVNGQGGIGAAAVGGVDVEGVGSIDEGCDVVGAAVVAVGGGIGVEDAGVAAGDSDVVEVAAVAVVECIGGWFGIEGESEGNDDEGDDGDGDSDGDGAKLAVGVDDVGIVIDPIAVAVVGTRVWHVGVFGLSLAILEGVC